MTDAEKILQKLGLKFGLDESSGMEAVALLMKDRERLIAALEYLVTRCEERPPIPPVTYNPYKHALTVSAQTNDEILGERE